MKVSELPYRRVTIEEVTAVMEDVIARIRNATSADEILAAREEEQKLMLEYQTNTALAYMRYSINTVDEFYVAENEYYDEIGPAVQNFSVQYASALLDSPFRAELEEKLSPVLFRAMEVERKSMSPEIVEDMVEENKLVREYSDLMSGMEFTFRGETMPRALLMKYAKSEDRRFSEKDSPNTRSSWTASMTAWSMSGIAWQRRWDTATSSSWAITGWAGSATTRKKSACSGKISCGMWFRWSPVCAQRMQSDSAWKTTCSMTTAFSCRVEIRSPSARKRSSPRPGRCITPWAPRRGPSSI